MMPTKLAGLLGIARRAGHTVIGFDAVRGALQNGKAQLILLATDCSAKTEKELRYTAEVQSSACPIRFIPATKDEIAAALGLQKPVATVATDDRGFAKAMLVHGTDTKEDVAL